MSQPWPPAPLTWPAEPLTDEGVALDRMTRDDAPAVAEACNDPEIARWLPVPVPYTLEDAVEFIDSLDPAAEVGDLWNFAIRRAPGGKAVGSIGAKFHARPGEVEIGYWIAPGARGRGLAARAIRVLAGHLFDSFDVHRVEILCDPGNTASRTAAERSGAVFEGVRRGEAPDTGLLRAGGTVTRDDRHDTCAYALIPADLAP